MNVSKISYTSLIAVALFMTGCGATATPAAVPTVPEAEPLVFAKNSAALETTTTAQIGKVKFSLETQKLETGAVKNFLLKKDGVVWKTVEVAFGESGIRFFKETDKHLYLAPEISGLGGYISYEAMPTRVIRINIATGEQKIFQVGGVLEDISEDEKQMLWIVAGQGSLSFAIYDTATGKRTLTIPVEKQFSQAGNARFSPDMKKFAYAAALGIPDREGGAVISVDIAKKQQTKLVEDLHANKVPHIYGWKTPTTVDFRFE